MDSPDWPARTAKPPVGRFIMKKLLVTAMLGMFTASIIGCHASADVDSPDNDHDTYSKKTTTVDNNGDRTVKTEVKKTN
jgi:hypothetical protein